MIVRLQGIARGKKLLAFVSKLYDMTVAHMIVVTVTHDGNQSDDKRSQKQDYDDKPCKQRCIHNHYSV